MAKDLLKVVKKYGKRLESCNNHEIVKSTLLKLSKLPITSEILSETRIGWTVNMLRKKHAEYKVLAKQLIKKWKTLFKVNKDRIMTTALKDEKVKKSAANPRGKKENKVTTEKLKTSKQMSFEEALNNNQQKGKKRKMSPTVVNESFDDKERLHQLVDYVKGRKPVLISQPFQDDFLKSDEDFINFSTSRKRGRTLLLPVESKIRTENSVFLQSQADCIKFLTMNIDIIVNLKLCLPFETARPMLENCNSVQLSKLEASNPGYLKHTNYIWKNLCKKDFQKETTDKNKSLAWKSVYGELRQHREKKMQAVKDKIHNSYKKCDQAKSKVALVEAGWEKNNRCNVTNSFSSVIRPAVVRSRSYKRSFEPEEIKSKKKTVAPLMAKARQQLKNRFRR